MNIKKKNRISNSGTDAYNRYVPDKRRFESKPDSHLESNGESEIFWIKNAEYLSTWAKGDYSKIVNDVVKIKDTL